MIELDGAASAVLARLASFGQENDARMADRSRKMLNLEPPTAELLYLLVTGARRRRVLEIGTSNGYSAIWLAHALRETDGQPLVTVEFSPDKAEQARANLRAAALQDWAQVIEGDATRVCAAVTGPFDCVFFDADRVSAPQQLAHLLPKLTPDALLVADNALSHPDEIAGYLAAVDALRQFDTTVVPVGKGLHIARRRRPA
ncbi:O-methyltransferase [Burkholderia pyrrocinia]|uniref:O-methyltransferase n=1 Tax=Burkholderia pyrrocinia TaxID=60550 RepID=UPI00064B9443|nr:class I SAM-dependent methyltransferase [Burkholderia pyrrocinia]AKM00571.1 methyltransferase [Burkholderia pyrrocinia]